MKVFAPVALAACLLFAASTADAAALTPTALRCEYQENPLGIQETAPRFSWQFASKQRGKKQTAFHIRVASSPEALSRPTADVWDTGRIATEQSTQVGYSGKPLIAGRRYYWQVRAWDETKAPGKFSRPAFFEMGLLDPDHWSARWIGLPIEAPQSSFSMEGTQWVWYPEGNPAQSAPKGTRYFRLTVPLPAGRQPIRATFHGSVDNNFTLFVNGKEAGQGSGWQSATPVDILSHLRTGNNVLAIAASNADEAGGPAGLTGRLHLQFAAGPDALVDVDGNWKAFNRELSGWQGATFDDKAWPAAKVLGRNGMGPWGATKAGGGEPGPAPLLRKGFRLSKSVRRARAYVTALGVYQLHMNGRRVGNDVLSPGWTDYRKRVQYLTYDVTDIVRKGDNAVGAMVGDGWYAGSLGPDLARNHFGPSPPRLRFQLNVEYADGSSEVVGTDATWRGHAGPIVEADLYAGETYDARREHPGWSAPGFREADWTPVTVYTDQNPTVTAHVGPPIRPMRELPTVGVTEPKPGAFVFDLGQNMVGWARLKARGPAGTRITLRFAETLNTDGTVYRDNLRRARATDTFILSGNGEEVLEPHFTYHGFRYVEVTGYPIAPGKTPSRSAITGVVFHSAMEATSRFQCSSELVNRLYRNVIWGQRANLMSVPTDCPQRDERLGWMGDAQLFARTSCWNMDMAGFYTKWMHDIVDAQSAAGGFSDIAPRVVNLADGAPAWAEAGLVVPWTLYQCYGDRRILERNFDAMCRYVDLLVSENPNLLWLKRRNNDFGDWVPAGETTNKDLIASAYLAFDLRLLSDIARAIGDGEASRKYETLAYRSRVAFNERFLGSDGKYLGDTQTAYAMAFAMDLVPQARKPQVSRRFAEAVERRQSHLATGFIGTAFLLPALTEAGRPDLAYQILLATEYPSWGYMIGNGATTIWELWNSNSEGPGMNSRNHFAFGTVAEWIQRYMVGIDTSPDAPGYRQIVIRPRLGEGIKQARGEYDSHLGTIVSDWKMDGDRFHLTVTVPVNATATVYLPQFGNTRAQVREGGVPIWRNGKFVGGREGLISGAAQGDTVVLGIGSGTYTFVIADPGAMKQ